MSVQSGDPNDAPRFRELSLDDVEAADTVRITKEMSNMLLVEIDDFVTYMSNNPKNKLLFDREKYSVDGKSLYTVLHADEARRVVLHDDPYVAIAPTPHEDAYRLWYGAQDKYMVKTPVEKVETLLEGVIDTVDNGNVEKIKELYDYVIDNQVRREVVGKLLDFGKLPTDRISTRHEGWLIDDMFLVTWEADVYLFTDHWKQGSYHPRRSSQYEEPGEFVTIDPEEELEPKDIPIGQQTYRFGKLELLFLYRVNWMLDWRTNIDDPALAAVIERTFNEHYDLL